MRPWHKTGSCLLLVAALAVTLARTVRGPNDWAEAHWLLDYRFGFVKRGLLGQLLTWATGAFGMPINEGLLAGVAWTAQALFVAVMAAIALRIARRWDWQIGVVAMLVAFATSPFVVMTGHLTGYFDHVFFALGAWSIWLALRERIVTGAVVQAVALFVHESCIVLILPAFGLAAALAAARAARVGRRSPSLWPLLLPVAVALLMAVVLSSPPAGFEAGFTARLRGFPFVGEGFAENTPKMLAFSLHTMWTLVSQFRPPQTFSAGSFALVVPTVAAMSVVLASRARATFLSLEGLAVLVTAALPQAMHIVAWDVERIWTYSIFTTFLVVWILAETADGDEPVARGAFAAAALAIVANLVAATPLMDNAEDHLSTAGRSLAMLGLLFGLAVLRVAGEPGGDRWRLRGRSLWELVRGGPRPPAAGGA